MEANRSVITGARKIRSIPIGTRYPMDRVLELDTVALRIGIDNRAEMIRLVLDEFLERKKAEGVI